VDQINNLTQYHEGRFIPTLFSGGSYAEQPPHSHAMSSVIDQKMT